MAFAKTSTLLAIIAVLAGSVTASPVPDVATLRGSQTQIDCIDRGCFYAGTGDSVPSAAFVRKGDDGRYNGAGTDLREEDFTAKMVQTHDNISPAWNHFDTLSSVIYYGAAFREYGAGSNQDKVASSEMAQCGEKYMGNGEIRSVVVADGASLMLAGDSDFLTVKNTSGHTVYVPVASIFGQGTNLICGKAL